MKNFFGIATFLVVAAASTSAMAGSSVNSTVDLLGSATPTCSAATASGNIGTIGGTGGTLTAISGLIDGNNAVVVTAVSNQIGTVTCNYQAYVGLESANGHLHTTATPPQGSNFVNTVDYDAKLTWASTSAEIDTTGANSLPLTKSNPQIAATAASGAATLVVTPYQVPSGKALMAGDYSDTLTVKIGGAL